MTVLRKAMMATSNAQRSFALGVVKTLRTAGHQALWAGGCVRDLLLQLPIKDYDVATSARPKQVRRLFPRTIPVGESFGVVRVLGADGLQVEVATFRTDGCYTDGRHPDGVEFATPQADAQRRDFTINGMFLDPLTDEIIDYVGGRADLQQRRLRAIGEPHARFTEDKLRLLRAVRFAARLDFTIEPATTHAIAAMAEQLPQVSPERIWAELSAMLPPPTRLRALTLLRETGLFPVVFPEIASLAVESVESVESAEAANSAELAELAELAEKPPSPLHQEQAVLALFPGVISLSLALAALATPISRNKAEATLETLCRRLRTSNQEREESQWLTAHRAAFNQARFLSLAKLKRLFQHPLCPQLLELHEATCRAANKPLEDNHFARALLARLKPSEIDPPALVTGADLIALGLRPGPAFKTLLDTVRDAQLEGTLTTKAEGLAQARRLAGLAPAE